MAKDSIGQTQRRLDDELANRLRPYLSRAPIAGRRSRRLQDRASSSLLGPRR